MTTAHPSRYEPLTLNDPALEDEQPRQAQAQPRQAQAQPRVVALSRAQLPAGHHASNAQLSADVNASEEAQLAAAIAASLDDAAIAQDMETHTRAPPEPAQGPQGSLAGPRLESLMDASECAREAAQLLWEVTLEGSGEEWRNECAEMCKLTRSELARILATEVAATASEAELAHALETLDALDAAMLESSGQTKSSTTTKMPTTNDALPPGKDEAAAMQAPPPASAEVNASTTPLLDLLTAPVPEPLPPAAARVPLDDGLAGLSLLDAPAPPSAVAAPAPSRDKGKAPAVAPADVLAVGHPVPTGGVPALGAPAGPPVPASSAPPSDVWQQLESLSFDAPAPARADA